MTNDERIFFPCRYCKVTTCKLACIPNKPRDVCSKCFADVADKAVDMVRTDQIIDDAKGTT